MKKREHINFLKDMNKTNLQTFSPFEELNINDNDLFLSKMAKQLCLIEFTNIKQMIFCKLIMSFLNKNKKKIHFFENTIQFLLRNPTI